MSNTSHPSWRRGWRVLHEPLIPPSNRAVSFFDLPYFSSTPLAKSRDCPAVITNSMLPCERSPHRAIAYANVQTPTKDTYRGAAVRAYTTLARHLTKCTLTGTTQLYLPVLPRACFARQPIEDGGSGAALEEHLSTATPNACPSTPFNPVQLARLFQQTGQRLPASNMIKIVA